MGERKSILGCLRIVFRIYQRLAARSKVADPEIGLFLRLHQIVSLALVFAVVLEVHRKRVMEPRMSATAP